MQQLHLVGFTTDHDALIFSARKNAKSGGFLVALDDELYDTIDEVARMRDGGDAEENGSRRGRRSKKDHVAAPRPESALSPRDIQMRLRAGRSIGSVANEAGVNEEWIMRFAVPILAEQAQVVSRAQGMTFAKARLGDSGRPLGESVWWNVADKGALMASDTFDQCWSAQHLRDSIWVVRFEFVNRKKRQRAEWEVDTRERTITGRNRLASELGYVEPGRRGRPPAPLPPVAKPAARPAAAAGATKRRTVARRPTATTKKQKKKAPAKRATTRKPAARKTAARKTTARRAPAKKTAAKKATARRPAPKRAAPKRATAKRTATAKRPTTKRPTAKRAPAKRTATKKSARRPAAKRAPAKKTSSRPRRQLQPTLSQRFQTPELESGEPTGSVTIRATRARGDADLQETAAVPAVAILADEPTPLPATPAVLSTPTPAGSRPAAPARRFGRLRRRRPPGG